MNNNTSKNSILKLFFYVIVIITTIVSIGIIISNNILSQVSRRVIDKSDLGIRSDVSSLIDVDKISNIVNIAILGVDETNEDYGRSDAIMIGTLDPIHNKLKVTSIMRDTYVEIPGYGFDKVNHSYAYGGPELTIKTLNQNFGLNITDYVKVNFNELVNLIDALGGIDLSLSQEELDGLNNHLKSAYNQIGSIPHKIQPLKNGKYHLDGFQALGYCRIRNTSNNDFDRTSRHRKILSEMFNKISDSDIKELASISTKLLPYVETSLSNKQILTLGANILSMKTKKIEQERFPRDEYCNDAKINGIYYLWYDSEYTEEQILEYIFNDNKIFLNPNQPIYVPQYEYTSDELETVPTENSNDNSITPTINDLEDNIDYDTIDFEN